MDSSFSHVSHPSQLPLDFWPQFQSHLARASMAAPGGSGGPTLGKPADPYAAYAEHEHDEEEGHENNNDQHLS